jgi:formate hydrogenlyase subunit 3/multisubunit Na+/H+ antiporter MnhD subunit
MYIAFVLLNLYRPGDLAERISPIRLTFGLLVIGFGLRLAIVPFHSWLTDLAEDAAPMVSVLLIALVNTTAVLFLIQSLQFFPVLVTEHGRGFDTLMLVGLATALIGPLLALVQQGMRRIVAYLLVYNAGIVTFGLATITPLGLAGAVFESFNQMLAVLLVFVSVGLLERPDGRPPAVRRDLLWRWPIAGAGLLGGGLMLVGVPPFGGYVSKLLIYEAAARAHPAYLILLVVSGGLALLALIRLARERLLGAPEEQTVEEEPVLLGTTELDRPAARRLAPEPRFSAILTVALLAICVGIGLAPQPLLALINDALRDLTFVRAL